MLRTLMAGLALAAAAGTTAWLVASPSQTPPPEPVTETDCLVFDRTPLAGVVEAVSTRTGHAIVIRTPGLAERPVTLRLDLTGDANDLLRRLGQALDRWDVALVREAEPARGWSVIAFTRTAPAVTDDAPAPFVVRVVEGRVRLTSDGRTMELTAGEEGGVDAGGRLAIARRIDVTGVARWRPAARPVPAETRPPVPSAFAWRVIGTTEDGRTVVEWGAPGAEPQRAVLEKGAKEFRVPLPGP